MDGRLKIGWFIALFAWIVCAVKVKEWGAGPMWAMVIMLNAICVLNHYLQK